jgi:uncharacterized YccA/Bax inhibitor family protein
MMRSGNPVLNDNTFQAGTMGEMVEERMTLMGTVHKTGILLFLVVISASVTWGMVFTGNTVDGIPQMHPQVWAIAIVGSILGLILALVTYFAPKIAFITAPAYCLAKGLFIGAISAAMEAMFPGIVVQAVGLTFGVLFALLAAYRSGLIKATENFKLGVVAATGGILLVYLATFVLGLFGIGVPYIHGTGLVGIGFSVFVVIIAALNLVLDFDFIENGAEMGAPKYMEWIGAFGLMVTLIWLYIEILHLLAKLRSR